MTLRYYTEDEAEMVIRLLSFGPVLRVEEPPELIQKLRERVERQAALLAE